ncbi:HAMP domain-containing sensor histidine kinase [Massilia sp. METH4]|uniref:sensor histidine kinase n=1 Tax=Massilia sp. METH4 TaxID=3123041 RepID=UPI0030D3E276
MTRLLDGLRTVGARPQWSTTAFRWLSIYALGFTFVVVILLGCVGYNVADSSRRGTNVIMHWQRLSFDVVDDSVLAPTLDAMLEQARPHVDHYGLFSPEGHHLAGQILTLPAGLAPGADARILRSGLQLAGQDGAPVVYAYVMRRPDGRLLVVARDITRLLSIRSTVFHILIAVGSLCLLAGLAWATLFSRRQLRRINETRRITALIASGDLNQRLPVTGNDELAMQSQLINHMLVQIERLMGEVKGTCDGIASDLRTPLSHVRALLRECATRAHAIADPATAQLIEQAGAETDVLMQRFHAMLRISEIGALQRREGFSPVDIDALVDELTALYEPVAEQRGIALARQGRAQGRIQGDHALLFEAFSNLLDNAIKFSPEHATVGIALTEGRRGPVLTISDQGPGIAADQRTAVLQRFYRAPQTLDRAGSGLGLSIVAAVVRLHDFELVIDSAHPGASMSVELWPHMPR